MVLTELGAYLARHRRAAIAELATHFAAEPEALRGMLGVLVAKGRVRRLDAGESCPGCARCPASQLEVYEWSG